MHDRIMAAPALGGVLLTALVPPPMALAAPPRGDDAASPVHCEFFQAHGMPTIVTTAQRAVVRVPMTSPPPAAPPAPPAPPPPPPPPPPPSAAAAAPVIRTSDAIPPSRQPAPPPYGAPGNRERYRDEAVAGIESVAQTPVSTFSVDVDTGAYANVRRFLTKGDMPPPQAVRTEEMINYFRYDYPRPDNARAPFSVTTDVAKTPWNANTHLLRIGLRGYDVAKNDRPPANLVFLVDVSGSMGSADKIGLLKTAMTTLADSVRSQDRVSIVAYSGVAGIVLDPTNNRAYIKQAVDCLSAGGSTAGGAAMKMAYDQARAHFVKNGVNRIFLATDGDFNVGVSDTDAIVEMVRRERDSGGTLTTLGFGTGNLNDAMMEQIADAGNGNYAYIDSAIEAKKVLSDQLSATMVAIASDVKVQVEFNPAKVKQYRLIGYENRALAEEDFDNDSVDAGDIGAGHQVTALYEIVTPNDKGWLPDRRYAANQLPQPSETGNELAFVKLRYKLPGEERSQLISTPVSAVRIESAALPTGDMAFVSAVAAFGQKLRGDKYLNGYGYADIARLAGEPTGYWRGEFVKLVELADAQTPARVDAATE